ncbi:hypothetical protein V6Z11_A01G253900 [Gossypium hirsutum]
MSSKAIEKLYVYFLFPLSRATEESSRKLSFLLLELIYAYIFEKLYFIFLCEILKKNKKYFTFQILPLICAPIIPKIGIHDINILLLIHNINGGQNKENSVLVYKIKKKSVK